MTLEGSARILVRPGTGDEPALSRTGMVGRVIGTGELRSEIRSLVELPAPAYASEAFSPEWLETAVSDEEVTFVVVDDADARVVAIGVDEMGSLDRFYLVAAGRRADEALRPIPTATRALRAAFPDRGIHFWANAGAVDGGRDLLGVLGFTDQTTLCPFELELARLPRAVSRSTRARRATRHDTAAIRLLMRERFRFRDGVTDTGLARLHEPPWSHLLAEYVVDGKDGAVTAHLTVYPSRGELYACQLAVAPKLDVVRASSALGALARAVRETAADLGANVLRGIAHPSAKRIMKIYRVLGARFLPAGEYFALLPGPPVGEGRSATEFRAARPSV